MPASLIGHDEIERLLLKLVERVEAITGHDDLVTIHHQKAADDIAGDLFIIHHGMRIGLLRDGRFVFADCPASSDGEADTESSTAADLALEIEMAIVAFHDTKTIESPRPVPFSPLVEKTARGSGCGLPPSCPCRNRRSP